MAEALYVRPTGILWGDAARTARDSGAALTLAGTKAAFLGVELIEGEPGSAKRSFRSAADLAASGDSAIQTLIQRIEGPRAAMAGIAFDRTRLMGIVNVTPDSFSDGGDFLDADRAAAHARQLVAEGAEIVDFGGEFYPPRLAGGAAGAGARARSARAGPARRLESRHLRRYPQGRPDAGSRRGGGRFRQ